MNRHITSKLTSKYKVIQGKRQLQVINKSTFSIWEMLTSIESLLIIIVMFFYQQYCHLIITDEIIDMAALIDCIHTNYLFHFHISDVLSCSENKTVYINFVS